LGAWHAIWAALINFVKASATLVPFRTQLQLDELLNFVKSIETMGERACLRLRTGTKSEGVKSLQFEIEVTPQFQKNAA
jgi:hypothetical protein